MRQAMVEVKCSRCKRVEYKAATDKPEPQVMMSATLSRGNEAVVEVVFDDLCSPCEKTVTGYLKSIAKALEGVSPHRKTKSEAVKKAPAPAPQPGTPAQKRPS